MKTSFKDLDVWQRSVDLAARIHQVTKHFPADERYGLTSQLRRCAVSIASNIAEGTTRYSDKETVHFLSIALASNAECYTQLLLSKRFEYITEAEWTSVCEEIDIIGRMLNALRNKLKAG